MTEAMFVDHLDNVPWDRAGVPPRNHRCWEQTMYVAVDGDRTCRVARCPCGAIRLSRGPWMNRNLTRTTFRPAARSKAA